MATRKGLAEKSRNDRVPYDVWARQGDPLTTPGASIAYEYVAEYLPGVFDRFNVRALAFDRYNMEFLKPWLERVGFTEEELARFIEFGQGFVSMSPAIRELLSLLLARKLRHGNHPVLAMCSHNATVVSDPAANRKFTKAMRRVVRKIKDSQGRPIWTPNYDAGISGEFTDQLLGYPVRLNNDMAAPG